MVEFENHYATGSFVLFVSNLHSLLGIGFTTVTQVEVKDRRRYTWYSYSTNLRFRRSNGKTLPARSVDISSGGMLLYVLAHQELFPGETITLHFNANGVADHFPDVYFPDSHDIQATIVRIERDHFSTSGYMGITVSARAKCSRDGLF